MTNTPLSGWTKSSARLCKHAQNIPSSSMPPLILRYRFQAASQKFGKPNAHSKSAGSQDLKERVEQYEKSKREVQQPRQTSVAQHTSSKSSIDNRVEKAAQQLQAAATELADALQASGARA